MLNSSEIFTSIALPNKSKIKFYLHENIYKKKLERSEKPD